ncbi:MULTISPECIES: LysR substrate-binding domain-containing protein [unclassified Cupriavidus]|uniref:LysR substrate-binding domain-containing protein n=1 Tax=Cupriavidus sp. H19C3 TaxID=3241603 RepID=UPI003BF80839
MELRQLRYFVRVVELNSMGRAAVELGLATSTLSQQISQLEGELATRLLQRRSTGVFPTDAGLDFFRQAQLILRQVETAVSVAHQGRLSGQVSIGMAATTASMLALPFVVAMRARYPAVRLKIVEGLAGNLEALLNSRQLDLAVVFTATSACRWTVVPLLDERLFLIGHRDLPGMPDGPRDTHDTREISVAALGDMPLILPSGTHTLRNLVLDAFREVGTVPNVALEVDGVNTLMDVVGAGIGATIQPGSLLSRVGLVPGHDDNADGLRAVRITDPAMRRTSLLASLPDDELSPAGLGARVVLVEVARELARNGRWPGAEALAVR